MLAHRLRGIACPAAGPQLSASMKSKQEIDLGEEWQRGARRSFDLRAELAIPAKRVRQPHLLRRAALGLEQPRAADEDHRAPRPRRGDVQAIEAVEELHPARRVLRARRGHRVDDDRRLLPLELVDGARPGRRGRPGAPPAGSPARCRARRRRMSVGVSGVRRRRARRSTCARLVAAAAYHDPRDRVDLLRRRVLVAVVLDGHPPQPGAVEGARRSSAAAARGPACESQLALVEHLRRERADRRCSRHVTGRNSPRSAGIVWRRRGCARAPRRRRRRVAALLRLLELLRIAEQHEARRRRRHRERVGERHLAGFVDEQHVDGSLRVLARPQPRGAAEDVHARRSPGPRGLRSLSTISSNGDSTVVRRRCRRPVAILAQLVPLATVRPPAVGLLRRTASSRLRITLWLTAVTPTLAALARPARGSSARRRRSCPRPAAPGSAASCVQIGREPDREVDAVSSALDENGPAVKPQSAIAGTSRSAAQLGPARQRRRIATRNTDRSASCSRRSTMTLDRRPRTDARPRVPRPFDVDLPRVAIVRHHLAELSPVRQLQSLPSRRNLDFLRGIAVAIDDRAGGLAVLVDA